MDVWIRDSLENRKKLSATFKELYGYEIPGVETMQFIPGWSTISLPSGFPLDILVNMKGLEHLTFDECLATADRVEIAGVTIIFLSRKNLLANKVAAGRPKDLLDIEELNRLHGDQYP